MNRLHELDGMDLVRAYLHVMRDGTKTAAAKAVGVDLSRLGQYRRGERPVPDHVQRVMRAAVLGYLLSGAEARNLARALTPSGLHAIYIRAPKPC